MQQNQYKSSNIEHSSGSMFDAHCSPPLPFLGDKVSQLRVAPCPARITIIRLQLSLYEYQM